MPQPKARRSVRLFRVPMVLVGAVLTLSAPLVLSAQSQGGGLPSTNTRVATLEAAVIDLKTDLAKQLATSQMLMTALATETAAPQAARCYASAFKSDYVRGGWTDERLAEE